MREARERDSIGPERVENIGLIRWANTRYAKKL
jgi:hypothetical protein